MRFKMRLLFEENSKINIINSLKKCPQYNVLKDICDRHDITLDVSYVNNMKLEMINTKEIVFNAEYDYKVNKWLISINSVDRVDSDKFASQLSKVNEFFSCVQEAEAIDVREIYKYLSELEG